MDYIVKIQHNYLRLPPKILFDVDPDMYVKLARSNFVTAEGISYLINAFFSIYYIYTIFTF